MQTAVSDDQPPPPPSNGDLLDRMEHLQHWWREPIAGIIAAIIAVYDCWHFGAQGGFSNSLDEILLLTGITLIAGVRNLFGGHRRPPAKPDQ
jgi:hypothetical protein